MEERCFDAMNIRIVEAHHGSRMKHAQQAPRVPDNLLRQNVTTLEIGTNICCSRNRCEIGCASWIEEDADAMKGAIGEYNQGERTLACSITPGAMPVHIPAAFLESTEVDNGWEKGPFTESLFFNRTERFTKLKSIDIEIRQCWEVNDQGSWPDSAHVSPLSENVIAATEVLHPSSLSVLKCGCVDDAERDRVFGVWVRWDKQRGFHVPPSKDEA